VFADAGGAIGYAPERAAAQRNPMTMSMRRAAPTPVYDRLAVDFDRLRPLPESIPAAIRVAILTELPDQPGLLDLGCGAGRLGWPMVEAGDNYTAVDVSLGMLRQFFGRGLARTPRLVQADGVHLPFPDAAFDGVMLMQVLSGTDNWRDLLHEVRRVSRADGVLFVGQSAVPEDGLDARMKQCLSEVLDGMGLRPYQRQSKEDAFDWLARHAEHTTRVVARWPMERTPRQFMTRHGGGARFSVLAEDVRTIAMSRLADWAAAAFGSLDAVSAELQSFVVHIYRFHQEAMS
jgi:ubiquinone/menaquinone biosynthesis C-methylase UbiE